MKQKRIRKLRSAINELMEQVPQDFRQTTASQLMSLELEEQLEFMNKVVTCDWDDLRQARTEFTIKLLERF